MKKKSNSKNIVAQDAMINEYKDKVEKLEAICKAFIYILPTPAETHKDCVTTTMIYKVQYNMARKMWVDYINSKTQ